MRALWKLYFLIGAFFIVAYSQEEGTDESHVEGEIEEGAEPNEDDTADDMGEEDSESENEGVWQEEPLTSDQLRSVHGKIDSNKDGKVTLEEVTHFSKITRKEMTTKEAHESMEGIDSDHDGKISLKEHLESHFGAPPLDEDGNPQDLPLHPSEDKEEHARIEKSKEMETQKFKAADKNKDGFWDHEELRSTLAVEHHDEVLTLSASESLQAKDKDGDGELTPAEFWETHQEDEDDLGEDAKNMRQADFEKLDVDKNGKLNVEEVKAWESGAFHESEGIAELFEVVDENEDKHLTAEEFEKARDALSNSQASSHLQDWVLHHEL